MCVLMASMVFMCVTHLLFHWPIWLEVVPCWILRRTTAGRLVAQTEVLTVTLQRPVDAFEHFSVLEPRSTTM